MQKQNERLQRKGKPPQYKVDERLHIKPLEREYGYLWRWCCLCPNITELSALTSIEGAKPLPWEVETVVTVNRIFNG